MIVDGLVLARSAFHHSTNYRSVVAHGLAASVREGSEKRLALDALVDAAARWPVAADPEAVGQGTGGDGPRSAARRAVGEDPHPTTERRPA
jgi:hypothetical protein